MYELAKVGAWLVSPLSIVLVCWFIAAFAWLRLKRKSLSAAIVLCSSVCLWLCATPLVAFALASQLEERYPEKPADAAPKADAIVVLGGALSVSTSTEFNMGAAADRVWYAAALYRAGKAPWIVVAAGGKAVTADGRVEADGISQMLVTLGVPQTAIRAERLSRNTRENARNASPILAELKIRTALLVTSALHMPRAVETFRRFPGAPPVDWIPAATDYEAQMGNISLGELLLPDTGSLSLTTRAVKEFAGLLALAMM